ncbi:IBR finger domain protein [Akanthomyces lecanii RCEF 1005]|uniref:RBR-type E3 ubiquitin transferase n=1 Tax=Akanthomyces lecanii RCEF 1005 TaxID=1081108 RepID=A0A168BZM0_CORDF|nr:IBR finger domain protein [Akanthomyces lecanii RCEF 1005]
MAASNEEENIEKPDGANVLRCISCGDEYSNESAAQAPCGHLWCAGCLVRYFGRATVDEGMFPPQCCTQPILLTDVRKWLPAELVTEFEEKQIEFTTPKRLYCANKRCSAFILPDNIAIDRGSCKVCGRATCTICNAAGHKGICSRDPARRRTMALAKREHWQKCYGCKTVVELDSGCNHISE